jgi:gluconokinase
MLMGVAGSGKTTIGRMLAEQLGWKFVDADDLHSPANVAKMSRGIPLTDADREPWLHAIRETVTALLRDGYNVVLACSALKKRYRDELSQIPGLQTVYLEGSYDVIAARLQHREHHYAHADLLPSQFNTLEEPDDATVIDVSASPAEIVTDIRRRLHI